MTFPKKKYYNPEPVTGYWGTELILPNFLNNTLALLLEGITGFLNLTGFFSKDILFKNLHAKVELC